MIEEQGIPVLFTFKVTEQQIRIISMGLEELPYKHSSSVMANLQQQLFLQRKAMAAKTEEKEPDKNEDNDANPDKPDGDTDTSA
jgi:hypothetical protein